MPTPDDSHPFRDSKAGVTAKRDKLLGDRRADLALMSHAIRRIYVSRTARIAGSLALILGGALLVAAAVSTDLAEAVAGLLPGDAPAPLANLLFGVWIVAALATLLGRGVAERRFTTAMSKAVLPSDDAHRDVARLAGESPDEVGRRMAHKQAKLGRSLPIAAAGLILPATAIAANLAYEAAGYPSLDRFESLLAEAPGLLIGFACLGALYGVALYFRPNRAALSLALLAIVHTLVFGVAWGPFLLVGALALGLLSWNVRRRQRHEEVTLGQDGAPLPSPLHLRKRIREAMARTIERARAIRSFRPRRVHYLGVGLAAVAGMALYLHDAAQVAAAQPHAATATKTTEPTSPAHSNSTVRALDDDRGLVLEYDFADRRALSSVGVFDDAFVPHGFQATVLVTGVQQSGDFLLSFSEGDEPTYRLSQNTGTLSHSFENCTGAPLPLRLQAEPYGEHYIHSDESELTARYYITLEYVGCY